MDVSEKLKVLKNTTIKDLEKKQGVDSYYLGEKKIPTVPLVCSSGSLRLDAALGIGGWPEGRIIEIGGQESSGKSTLTLINIAEVQRNGKLCAYIDVEQSFDPSWAEKIGVDTEKLLVTQPETMEEALEQLYSIIDSGVVSLIVVDSTNAMQPKSIFEGEEVGKATMGLGARILSQELPKVKSKASSNKCTVIFLSQIRATMDKYHPEAVGIGLAMRYFASIRIKTSRTMSDVEKDDAGEIGQSKMIMKMNVFKNKVAVPFKKAEFTLFTGEDGKYGIDTNTEILEFAVKYDIIVKAGAWFKFGEERFQGFEKVKDYLAENPDVFETIRKQVVEKTLGDAQKEMSAKSNSFTSVINEIASEEKKPKRKKKDVDEGNFEETAIVTEAEIVERE